MVARKAIPCETKAYIKYMKNTCVDKLCKQTGVSRAHIYKLWKEPVGLSKAPRKAGGRPRKLSKWDERRLLRLIKRLRVQHPNWTIKRLMDQADITTVSVRTVRRLLNRRGYYYLQARKKGLLTANDRTKRVGFAKMVLRDYGNDIWSKEVAFYLDGVGFAYKRNPMDQALAPHGRVWRQKSEGFSPGCTAKGSACGTGGNYVHLIVTITYGKGVTFIERYEKMNGDYFADFLRRNFQTIVENSGKETRLWVQDGDPSQNSNKSKQAQEEVNSQLFPIPARSPDLNPIENLFKITKDLLREEAISRNIISETKAEFEARIRRTLLSIPIETIDRIIMSMNKRLHKIIANKGNRLKY